MKITVVIPTYKRASLLRAAIESVRNQSRHDIINEVIVSENSDDQESVKVIRAFPDLPLRHIFQSPPTDPGTHFLRLIELATTEWIALLGDDDMWGRYHLEDAIRALSAHPEAVAYAGQFVCVKNTGRTAVGAASYPLAENLGKRDQLFQDCWVFNALDMGVASLLLTPFNMWALVGRRAALMQAFQAFTEPGAGYDSDRYMFWLLAQAGPIVIGREIGLFYRYHDGNANARLLSEDFVYQQRMAGEYTRRILLDAESKGMRLQKTWHDAVLAMPMADRRKYWEAATPGAKQATIDAWGPHIEHMFIPPTNPLKRLARDWIPPFLWRQASRVRGYFS